MTIDAIHNATSWRVVLFTDLPGNMAYHMISDAIRPLGHRIVGVVTSPGPRNRRTTDYVDVVASVPPGIDTIVTSHPKRIAAMIAPLQPDLIISAGFRWMLPEDAIALPRIGAINLHPSLLPRHRGPHPLEWTFRSGDTEAGFTVHKLAAGFDTGPVLSQARVPVEDDDDVEALVERMFPVVPSLIVEALQGLAHGESGIAQVQDDATHAGPFEDEWRTIDWSRSAREIHNQIRSWSGNRGIEAGAFADIDGSRYTIHRTRLIAGRDHDVMPVGTRLNLGVEGVFVQCGDGPIEIIASDPPFPPGNNRIVDPPALAAIRMRQFATQET